MGYSTHIMLYARGNEDDDSRTWNQIIHNSDYPKQALAQAVEAWDGKGVFEHFLNTVREEQPQSLRERAKGVAVHWDGHRVWDFYEPHINHSDMEFIGSTSGKFHRDDFEDSLARLSGLFPDVEFIAYGVGEEILVPYEVWRQQPDIWRQTAKNGEVSKPVNAKGVTFPES